MRVDFIPSLAVTHISDTGLKRHATGGKTGHVLEVPADDKTWVLRYIVVDTGNWLLAKKKLLVPLWINYGIF